MPLHKGRFVFVETLGDDQYDGISRYVAKVSHLLPSV